MEEQTSKKREWIKNAAIIFLVVMLLLTFFSNTIMNYSLPEVATSYVTNGTITTKIRGNGMVEAEDPFSVTVSETREITSVLAKKDDHVEAGQTLYTLKDAEGEELQTAKDELAKAKLDYQKAILTNGLSREEVSNIERGNVPSLQDNQSVMENLDKQITFAENALKLQETTIQTIENKIALLEKTTVDTTAEKNAYSDAQKQLNALEVVKRQKAELLSQASDALEGAPADADLQAAKAAALAEYNAANNAVINQQAVVDNAKLNLDNKTGNADISNQITQLERDKITAQTNVDNTKITLEEYTTSKEEMLKDILAKMDLSDQYKAINEQAAKVEKLQKAAIGAEITAPVAGTVLEMNLTAGQKTSPEMTVAVIREDGKECTVSIIVTNEQAKRVSVGDMGEVQNSWYYSDISLMLKSIKPDSDNPGKNKKLTFSVNGDVQPGQSLGVSVGQKSSSYDLIVPNSAIREDNNGKFILIVESKSTPFGNRYVATKTEIEVLATDDTNTAISAPLYGYEYVLTTSNKPVEPGQQVRLAE